jgi:hypothetical protein
MADTEAETVTFTIEADGDEEQLTVPRELVGMLADGDQRPTEVVGDLAMLSMANRIHHFLHHSEGEPDPRLSAVEAATMDLFEDRFGQTFGEMTGHSH